MEIRKFSSMLTGKVCNKLKFSLIYTLVKVSVNCFKFDSTFVTLSVFVIARYGSISM